MDKIKFLAQVPLLSFMKKKEIKRIAELAEVMQYRAGDMVFKEGDRDGRLFVVISGEVEVVKNLDSKHFKRLRLLGPGNYFGEMAMINDMVRSASVRAVTEVALLCLEGWNLRQQLEKYPFMAVELLQVLSRRIIDTEKHLMNALEGLLPICANCKSIRDEKGNWVPLEKYLHGHTQADFTHSICPVCQDELYSGLADKSAEE